MAHKGLDDEYVTKALKSDAEKASNQYSSLGVSAYLPRQRPPGAAPKPNTRFLRNLIQETDTHNSALLAKEKREARERERDRERETRKRDRARLSPHGEDDEDSSRYEKRRREDRDEHSARRRKRNDHSGDEDRKRQRHHRSSPRQSRSRSPRRSRRERDNVSGHERRRGRDHGLDGAASSSDVSRSPHRRHRTRDRERSRDRHSRHSKHDDRSHRRSRRTSSTRSRSRTPVRRRRNHAPPLLSGNGTTSRITESFHHQQPTSRSSSSDPLEAIVGPLPPDAEPPLRSRGRGAISSSAAMDSHFNSTYDPKVDVQPDPETEDDWDQALEALRDRQRWQQQGAERLKAAGFSDLEVKKWEKGDAKDESDVRWAKEGEGREWDRGKVVEDDGVTLRPEWGRLKDT